MAEITKSYEPREVEKKWYAAWLDAGRLRGQAGRGPRPLLDRHPAAERDGVLTMGHVLNNTLQDILIRRARLEGRSPSGSRAPTTRASRPRPSSSASCARRRRPAATSAGRSSWKRSGNGAREKGGIILEQLRRLGASCDWDRTQFTMDPVYSRAVLGVFVDLFRKGHIYRGKRMVNWCPASLTALSDEEVIMKPVNGTLYEVRYELSDAPGKFIQVATTRPETIPGDVAIAVHPDDPRYAGLVGRKVWRPLNRAPRSRSSPTPRWTASSAPARSRSRRPTTRWTSRSACATSCRSSTS